MNMEGDEGDQLEFLDRLLDEIGSKDDELENHVGPSQLVSINSERVPTNLAISHSRRQIEANLEILAPPTVGDAQIENGIDQGLIWGSAITTKSIFFDFHRFLTEFKKGGEEDQDPYCFRLLDQMRKTEIFTLNLDCINLKSFDPVLFENLINFPSEVISIMDEVVNQVYRTLYEEEDLETGRITDFIQVRPYNLPKSHLIRTLDPNNIDTLLSLHGMILRITQIIPEIRRAYFECNSCKNGMEVDPIRGHISEPTKCRYCQTSNMIGLVHNLCTFADKQYVKLQEAPDSVPEGATPQSVLLQVHDTLVDTISPGDKVIVTGVFRTNPPKRSVRERKVKSVYRTFLDVVHFQKITNSRSENRGPTNNNNLDNNNNNNLNNGDNHETNSDLERKKNQFEQLAKHPDIYNILVRSFAPSIWEMEDIKKGVLCLLFGGTKKTFLDSLGSAKFRAEINILLCGDPGTSKSQILQFVHKICTRGVYTSGKGSSAVGLTAYITKDVDTGETILESGALTLSDNGICCIDEFDKMNETTRSILHEAMEQQTVSVAKAGIVATLNARTSILASANPRESRYNTRISVVDNIKLPPTLLSRFDLIYLVLDRPNRELDAKLARHIVSLYFKKKTITSDANNNNNNNNNINNLDNNNNNNNNNNNLDNLDNNNNNNLDNLDNNNLNNNPLINESGLISTQTLTDYISYSKLYCHPVISEDALNALVQGYVEMRGSDASHKTITATTRQLESLIRISEALSKMTLSSTVLANHVHEAIRLMKAATYKAAMDPVTGLLDLDLINTGRGQAHELTIRNLMAKLMDIIQRIPNETLPLDVIWNHLIQHSQNAQSVNRSDFIEAIHLLEEDSIIALTGSEKSKQVRIL